jgi:HD-GYP domain-containing protein (c-di-GMP phosphodiesterase class II)
VLQRGGTLHDLGKIGVPDAVLNKPGRLTAEEIAQMQRHPEIGYDLLRDMAFLHEELGLIRHHHERWDGSGYPDQLRGEAIPRGACILGVADAFDAMTSDRPYRRGLPVAEARARLQAGAGTQFWPPAVEALLAALEAGGVALPQRPLAPALTERAS